MKKTPNLGLVIPTHGINEVEGDTAGTPNEALNLEIIDSAIHALQTAPVAPAGATAFTGLSDVPASYAGADGEEITVKADGSGLQFVPRPYDVSAFAPGTGSASQKLLRVALTRAVSFFTGSLSAAFGAKKAVASAAATASTTFTLSKNGTAFATVNFAEGSAAGVWTQSATATFAPGDVLEIDGPATADETLADVGITLAGSLQ
jgi:hypothetical protein